MAGWQKFKSCLSAVLHSCTVFLRSCSLLDVGMVSIVAISVMVVTYTGADPDLWGHLRFGADAIASGRLTPHDPYSFTSDIAWVNHEWLSEVIFAALYTYLGAAGINLFKLLVVGMLALLLWRSARRGGASPFAAVLFTGLMVVVTSTRTQSLRPQLFSVLFFALLIVIADRIEHGHDRAAIGIPFLFCAWANVHGGWIVGLGALTVWAALTRRFALIAVAAGATLINPYGFGLWMFVHDTVGLARPDIADWMPLFKLPVRVIAVECAVPGLAAVAVWYTRRLPPLRHVAVIALLAFGTVRVCRLDAFLMIAVAMICAPALASGANALDARLRRSGALTRPSFASAVTAGLMAVVAVGFTVVYLGRIVINGPWVPDAEALRFIKGHMSNARLLTWFDWGEYAIWHLSPNGIQVSMDGRRETVYSDRVINDHWAFYHDTDPDAWRYPDRIGVDRAWLPKKLPAVKVLRAHGWQVAFESPVSVVLVRGDSVNQLARLTSDQELTVGEFPGP